MPKSDLVFGTFSTSTSNGKYYKTQPINFPTPEKDVEVYEVPGRSGDLIVDYGSYKNVEITAEIAIQATAPDTFLTLYDALRASIMVQSGYQRLEDSLYPGEYRIARCTGVEMQQADSMRGTATITFDAKPQRYLDSGDVSNLTPVSYMTSQCVMGIGKTILNSTALSMMGAAGVTSYENREYMALNISAYTAADDVVKIYYPETYTSTLTPSGSGPYYNCIALMKCNTGSPLINESPGQMSTQSAYLTNDKTYEVKVGYVPPVWLVFPMPLQLEIYHNGAIAESLFADYRELIPPNGVVRYSPLIHIYVNGAISDPNVMIIADSMIGLNTPAQVGDSVTLTDLYIDCDSMNAYAIVDNTTYNLNQYVTMTGAFSFSGVVKVQTNTTIVSVEVYPRWWKI